MRFETNSYDHQLFWKEGRFIHQYFLHPGCRDVLLPQDLAVIFGQITEMLQDSGQKSQSVDSILFSEPLLIHYQKEGLVKEIQPQLANDAVAQCMRYLKETQESEQLSDNELQILLNLNHRLELLEQDIKNSFKLIFSDLQSSQSLLAELPYNSATVEIEYELTQNHPMFNENNENILHMTRVSTIMHPEHFNEWEYTMSSGVSKTSVSAVYDFHGCFLLHDLIYNSKVPAKYLCCIGNIWVETHVEKRQVIRLDKCNRSASIYG